MIYNMYFVSLAFSKKENADLHVSHENPCHMQSHDCGLRFQEAIAKISNHHAIKVNKHFRFSKDLVVWMKIIWNGSCSNTVGEYHM